MPQTDLGLPDILDAEHARRLGETARATVVAFNRSERPPAPVTERDLRKLLAAYCRAWADLQSGVKAEIELHNFDTGKPMTFSFARLRPLEQQIARLQQALGMPASRRANWA